MIPMAQIIQWRASAPWPDDLQVEQDLILSRILINIFSGSFLNKELAFRGGTALHKLFIPTAARYSEDIDLVRTTTGPIVKIADALQECLEPWLGKAKTKRTVNSFKLFYYFNPESNPAIKLRIKIEVNVRETFSILDRQKKSFSVNSDWFSGEAQINTFQLEELIATKIRALYQRSKGRDLFDLWVVLNNKQVNTDKAIAIFHQYMKKSENVITKKLFKKNLEQKLADPSFLSDINPLLSMSFEDKTSPNSWDLLLAAEEVESKVINHL